MIDPLLGFFGGFAIAAEDMEGDVTDCNAVEFTLLRYVCCSGGGLSSRSMLHTFLDLAKGRMK